MRNQIQIQEAQRTLTRTSTKKDNSKTTTPGTQDKEKILGAAKEQAHPHQEQTDTRQQLASRQKLWKITASDISKGWEFYIH